MDKTEVCSIESLCLPVCVFSLSLSLTNFYLFLVQQSSGVLVEHDMNNLLLHSPDQVGSKADRALLGSSAGTPIIQQSRSLGAASNQGIPNKSSFGNPCAPVSSPTVCGKKQESHSVGVTCSQSASLSVPLENRSDNAGNDASFETFGM